MMSYLNYASPSNSVLEEASIDDLSAPSSMILSGSPMVDGLGSPLLQQSSRQGLSLSLSTQQRKIQPSSPATVINSRYLKVAQQLLDEVVNVRASLKNKSDNNQTPPPREDDGSKSIKEASSIEREDLQNKISKLLAMLDEVLLIDLIPLIFNSDQCENFISDQLNLRVEGLRFKVDISGGWKVQAIPQSDADSCVVV